MPRFYFVGVVYWEDEGVMSLVRAGQNHTAIATTRIQNANHNLRVCLSNFTEGIISTTARVSQGRLWQKPGDVLRSYAKAKKTRPSGARTGTSKSSADHLPEIAKLTMLILLGVTVTDFSHVFGSVNRGRSTLCCDKTS